MTLLLQRATGAHGTAHLPPFGAAPDEVLKPDRDRIEVRSYPGRTSDVVLNGRWSDEDHLLLAAFGSDTQEIPAIGLKLTHLHPCRMAAIALRLNDSTANKSLPVAQRGGSG